MDDTPWLFKLPLEIREKIYDFHFSHTLVTIHPATVVIEPSRARTMQELRGGGSGHIHPDLALLQACKQTNLEAEPRFYRTAMFRIDIMVRRPFVPLEKLYQMRRFCGGAEVRQLLALDEVEDPKFKRHCIVGPFEPEQVQARELVLADWMSDPSLAFMLDEANQGVHRPIHLDMYLSVYMPWVM